MSGYYNESDPYDDTERQGGSGGGLRKQLEEALAKVQRLEGRLQEREQRSVTDLLKDKGIDPALAEIVPEDKPREWIEKYAHLLGAKPQVASIEENPAGEPTIEAPADDDPALVKEREAVQRMQESQKDGSPSVVSSDLFERMSKIDSESELLAFFNANGAPDSQ